MNHEQLAQQQGGNYKQLDSKPPEGTKPVSSVMTMEATVDVKKQELRKMRPFQAACMHIPAVLKPEAQIVLQALLSCFEKQKDVQEGLIGDLVWGFDAGGIPMQCSMVGLQELAFQGYIKFQAPDNSFVDITSEHIGSSWVRYQPKLLDMVYSGD